MMPAAQQSLLCEAQEHSNLFSAQRCSFVYLIKMVQPPAHAQTWRTRTLNSRIESNTRIHTKCSHTLDVGTKAERLPAMPQHPGRSIGAEGENSIDKLRQAFGAVSDRESATTVRYTRRPLHKSTGISKTLGRYNLLMPRA